MQDQNFQIAAASLLLQDQQRLIAAGKVQRWDVVKWTTAVNLALATASVSIGTGGGLFFLSAVFVALAGGALVYHYNRRMTGARRDADMRSTDGANLNFRPAGLRNASPAARYSARLEQHACIKDDSNNDGH